LVSWARSPWGGGLTQRGSSTHSTSLAGVNGTTASLKRCLTHAVVISSVS
jgi:hypothetical protein